MRQPRTRKRCQPLVIASIFLAIAQEPSAPAHAAVLDEGDVAEQVNPFGDVTLSAGRLVGSLGRRTVNGGSVVSGIDNFDLGGAAQADGQMIIDGAGSRLEVDGAIPLFGGLFSNLGIGNFGRGSLHVSNGGRVTIHAQYPRLPNLGGGGGAIGLAASGNGTLSVTGRDVNGRPSLFTIRGSRTPGLIVGVIGTGNVDVRNGACLVFDVEESPGMAGIGLGGNDQLPFPTQGGHGELVVSGPGSYVGIRGARPNLDVGGSGSGTVVLEDGALLESELLTAANTDSTADLTVRSGAKLLLMAGIANEPPPAELAIECVRSGPPGGTSEDAGAVIGYRGTAVLDIEGGTVEIRNDHGVAGMNIGGHVCSQDPTCEPSVGGDGTVNVTGPASELWIHGVIGGLGVGANGTGRLNVTAGGKVRVESFDSDGSGVGVGFTPGSDGSVTVTGPGSAFETGRLLLLGLNLDEESTGTASVTVSGQGVIQAETIKLGPNATLCGSGGTVLGSLLNLGGTVCPGSSPGRLRVTGDYEQRSGKLAIEIGGREPGISFDVLDVDGEASLGGTLEIAFVDGFVPEPGDTFPFLTAADASGSFEFVVVRNPPPGTTPVVEPGSVVSVVFAPDTDGDGAPNATDNCLDRPNGPGVTDAGGSSQRDTDGDGYGNVCDPDLDGNRIVNFADLLLFKQRFLTANSDADFNGDGIVNFLDIPTLKAHFFGVPGPSGLHPSP